MSDAGRAARRHDGRLTPLQLSAYVDGELSRDERIAVEAHLSACSDCAAQLDALRSLSATLAALPRTAPSDGVFDRVLAGARRVSGAHTSVSREDMGHRRAAGRDQLRDVRLPDMGAPAAAPEERRRASRRPSFTGALSTIAALLLIALTAGLLMRSSLDSTTQYPTATPTATIPAGDTVNATAREMAGAASALAFAPVPPTYLPAGAQLAAINVTTLAGGQRCLDVSWKLSAGPLRALHLREQPASAPIDAYSASATQTDGLAWQVSKSPTWRAMTQVDQPGWVGVEQGRGSIRLLLDAQPAPGASSDGVATELRLTSLSLDAPYDLPRVAIGQPAAGALLRSTATVTGAGGQVWGWDVIVSADGVQRNATITPQSGGAGVTEITYSGTGVRLDPANKRYQLLTPPTPSPLTPSDITEVGIAANAFLKAGKLWNLGVTSITPLGGHMMKVYDLYRVDTARPEHVYADATTGAVVAIFVDETSSLSPGGSGSAQPYVSTSVCSPFTVAYTWLIYEPAAQIDTKSLFNTIPPPTYTAGSVPAPFTCGG